MSLADFLGEFSRRNEEMKRSLAEDALRAGQDAAALIKSRVQQDGQDSDNQSFEAYTPDYSKARAKAGYQTAQVDFTRTGKMWASFRPAIVEETENSVSVELSFSNAEDQTKANGQTRKRGNIAAISAEEEQIILNGFAQRRVNELLR